MSHQRSISEADFHKQRRSLLRKKTRAGWGVGLSSAMTASGLYYMAVPAGVAAYGYKNSGDTLEDLEQIMAARGIKPRSRDRLASFLIGTTEKLAISAVTLGQSEAACLDGYFGLKNNIDNLAHLNTEVLSHDGLKGANLLVNMPVDFVQHTVHYESSSHDVSDNLAMAAAAGVTEYGLNKMGDAGSNARCKVETGQSQHAMWQGMGVRRF
ncbi:uncharacterized protein M421DRAFT_418207 [Didymella exigua CBS 183.55]|uniref:Uncharacterized protein n=1 Tax=Didymella exigua CBS 183.55 TaxID=1150837 RepID=A0A6A5RTE8_9PLEO|nr:uncharacterized protein M421DRAFT_418207 [Didymella exigua CBS 183.55]KAF1930723.1 hypothetical protein M421DRAFT_418207 [Didymella exigua CBS 183.55]